MPAIRMTQSKPTKPMAIFSPKEPPFLFFAFIFLPGVVRLFFCEREVLDICLTPFFKIFFNRDQIGDTRCNLWNDFDGFIFNDG